MFFAGTGVTAVFWKLLDYLWICYAIFSTVLSAKGFVYPFLREQLLTPV